MHVHRITNVVLCHPLHVEPELHHIPVPHHILLALHAGLPGRPGLRHRAGLDQVFEGDDLGLDEALLEVGVDDSGGFGGRGVLLDGPGPGLLGACREVGLEAEGVEAAEKGKDGPADKKAEEALSSGVEQVTLQTS